MNKLWYIHKMEYNAVIKRKEKALSVVIRHWFSARGDFSSQEIFGNVWRHF